MNATFIRMSSKMPLHDGGCIKIFRECVIVKVLCIYVQKTQHEGACQIPLSADLA